MIFLRRPILDPKIPLILFMLQFFFQFEWFPITPMEDEETRRQGVPLGRRFHALYENK